MTKLAISILLGGAAIATGYVACGGSDSQPAPIAAAIDGGKSCANPLAITGLLAAKPFPAGKEIVHPSGDATIELPEGGIGAVRAAAGGWELAILVHGKPVRLPDSHMAAHIVADDFPGTPYKLVAFSHTAMKARGVFGGKDLYEVDRAAWALEIQLLDEAGQVAARTTVKRTGEAIVPFDIDVAVGDRNAAILVQWDKRGYLDSRARGNETTATAMMEIIEITLAGGKLNVTEHEREALTRDDVHTLLADRFPAPKCSDVPDACGPIPAGRDLFSDCGDCPAGKVCDSNRCRDVALGACVPTSPAAACPKLSCGKRYDGCASLIDCGGCAGGLECGGGEQVGVCSDPFDVSPSDVRGMFGDAICGCFADDRGHTITVDCRAGQHCDDSLCVGTALPDPNAPDLFSPDSSTAP